MAEFVSLVTRHIKVYLRDKTSVLFSFLSIIILLAIYVLFLGAQFDNIIGFTKIQKEVFKMGFIFAGVLVVGTITLSLGVIGTYVADMELKRLDGFLVSPLKRSKLIFSYFVATVLVTFVLCLIMFLLATLYLGITSGYWYSIKTILNVVLILLLFVCISSPILILMVSFIKSMNAFGGLTSIVGTLIGFISGIYIPLAMLDNFTRTLASILPFSHMSIYLKRLLIGNEILDLMPIKAQESASVSYITVAGLELNIYVIFAIYAVISLGLLTLAYFRMTKKAK